MRRKRVDPPEVSGKEVAGNIHILIASSYFEHVCFGPEVIRGDKISHSRMCYDAASVYLQIECYFWYLYHVTRHDSSASPWSRRLTPSSSRWATLFLLLAFPNSLLATPLPFNLVFLVLSFPRGPLPHSSNFVAITSCICARCSIRESNNNAMLRVNNIV